uniref:Uncharacterized protein n=1 Tax=Setaria digitata TaxID=48799 RepID=A0A915PMK9_9BILA
MTNEFADVISVSNSDSSSETYTISEDEEVEEEDADEETDEKKIMEAESVRKRFKLMILETTDANESNTVNLTEGDKIRGLEMVTNTTALNLEKVSVNETVTQSNQESEDGTSRKQTDSETMILTQTVDANFAANTQQDSMAITGAIVLSESLTSDVSSNAPVSEISPESAPEQTLSKSSIKISSERSNEITPESSFGAIISKATPFPQAFFHQNVPTANDVKKNPKAPDAVALISPQVTTSRTNPKTAAFQKDVPGTSRSLLEQSTFSISGSGQNGQKLAAVSIASPVSIQPTIISGSGTEAQATVPRLLPETAVSQQVQVQRSFSAPTSESSENQVSSQIQQAPQLSEPNVASTCPESLSNLVSSTGKECLAHEAVPGITAAIIPEIPGAAESDVMEKGNDRKPVMNGFHLLDFAS